MGTPVPWPPPYAYTDCFVCTPYLWPAGKTPSRVKMSVWGIDACPDAPFPAPNGLYVLRQLDPLFCTFRLITSDFTFLWQSGAGRTDCYITAPPTYGSYFYYAQPPMCQTFMNNQHEDCVPANALGSGGTVMIFWP